MTENEKELESFLQHLVRLARQAAVKGTEAAYRERLSQAAMVYAMNLGLVREENERLKAEIERLQTAAIPHRYLCVRGDAHLYPGRVYQGRSDSAASERGMVRVIDDSGSDHLYPKSFFHDTWGSGTI